MMPIFMVVPCSRIDAATPAPPAAAARILRVGCHELTRRDRPYDRQTNYAAAKAGFINGITSPVSGAKYPA